MISNDSDFSKFNKEAAKEVTEMAIFNADNGKIELSLCK
jgi:hypothetical protein